MCGVGKGVYLPLPVLAGASFCADIHEVLDVGVGVWYLLIINNLAHYSSH